MNPTASSNQLVNDGGLQYGSWIITLKYSASPGSTAMASYASTRGVYILEACTITRPGKLIRQRDEIGGPRAQALVRDFVDGTATLQINDSASGNPQIGDVFSLTFEAEIGAEYFFIGSLGAEYKQEDYYKRAVTLHKAVNPTTVPNFTPP